MDALGVKRDHKEDTEGTEKTGLVKTGTGRGSVPILCFLGMGVTAEAQRTERENVVY